MSRHRLTADQWNERYPEGTPVVVYPGARPDEPSGPGEGVETVTVGEAWTTGFGRDVVMVRDHGAWMSLSHVDPLPAETS